MLKLLGKYKDDYEELENELKEETSMGTIYRAYNKKNKEKCCLKIMSKEKLKTQDYDFLLERIKNEQEIQILCNSTNTVHFHRRLETEENIIFELEYCEINLYDYYLLENELKREKDFFREIVVSIAYALKTLNDKGIMHRNIKPHNIYIKSLINDKNRIIKLGNFDCAIKIKENPSDSIGTILYNAPEILKDLEYDEKVDLWSLGVTLFELYFGVLPFGLISNINSMMNAIYDEKNFVLQKTFKKNEKPQIPTLDILFRRLLTINPEDRMTYKEFFTYVFSYDFMKEGVTCVNHNPKYKKIFDDILNEKFIDYEEELVKKIYDDPIEEEKNNQKKINILVTGGIFPDIMIFSNADANYDNKFNNIIYYDVNVNHLSSIKQDSDDFERVTPGAFILCTNMDSFKLIRTEILCQIEKDKRISFNIITTGSQCENVIQFLDENKIFKNCIKNICVYCMDKKKWGKLKKKYKLLVSDVVDSPKDVIDFIRKFSSEEIKPFQVTKLISFNDYLDKYKERHIKISQFYGDLTPEKYLENIQKSNNFIILENKDSKINEKEQKTSLKKFISFDIKKDLYHLDKLLIRDYTNETFFGDFNKWILNTKFNSYEMVAYFTARFMYIINKYANKEGTYYSSNETEVRRGMKLLYSSLLPYERAKGKVILLSSFTPTTEEAKRAEFLSGRNNTNSLYKTKKKFSVILIIKNYFKNNWISNGVTFQELSEYEEKEILFLPFSFYYVRDVQIDQQNYKADIYLETIGKQEILEEKIKIGKEIKFNQKEFIMQVK